MKVKSKLRYVILVMIPIIFFQLAVSANAAEVKNTTFTKDKFQYTVTKAATKRQSGTVSVGISSQAKDTMIKADIPETVEYNNLVYQVTDIRQMGFYGCKNLTAVVMPDTVTTMESLAFAKCKNLMSIKIPASVTAMATNSFYGCSSSLVITCDSNSKAYSFASTKGIKIESGNKLIIIGDSRSNNMSKWVNTSVRTQFIAKAGQGYQWFVQDAIAQVNAVKEPGDSIIIWLGVNDYFSNSLGGDSWGVYANKINSLVANEWSECNVYVASVGYVDRARIFAYYGNYARANVVPLENGNQINGIQEFNQKLKASLSKEVSWLDTYNVIGINSSDMEMTPEDIWFTRSNGRKDGLHYSLSKTQEIYDFFVANTMPIK